MSNMGLAQTTCSSAIILFPSGCCPAGSSRRPSLGFSRLVGRDHAAAGNLRPVECTIVTLFETFSGNPSPPRVESQSRETGHNAMLSPLVGLQGTALQAGQQAHPPRYSHSTGQPATRPANPSASCELALSSFRCQGSGRLVAGFRTCIRAFTAIAPGTALEYPRPRPKTSNYPNPPRDREKSMGHCHRRP